MECANDEDDALYVQETARAMLEQLQTHHLEVQIVDECRRVVSQNTQWYRDFCAAHATFRRNRPRTIIKRCHTVSALKRLIRDPDSNGVYSGRLMETIGVYWDKYAGGMR